MVRFTRALPRPRRPAVIACGATIAALVPLAALAAVGLWMWRTDQLVDFDAAQAVPVVYAAGQRVGEGLSVEGADLVGTLQRLGYREVAGPPGRPGEFRRAAAASDIFLRPRDDPQAERPAMLVRLALHGPRVVGLSATDGRPLPEIELDPEPLTVTLEGEARHPISLTAVPTPLIAAVLAIEDHRFFEHRGLDATAILRAATVNLRRGEIAQGASTLTQQLVKNLVFTPRRTWDRKLAEAAVATVVEWRHPKWKSLEAYLKRCTWAAPGCPRLRRRGRGARLLRQDGGPAERG